MNATEQSREARIPHHTGGSAVDADVRTRPTGFICGPRVYEFDGWLFEYHQTSVWPLKIDGEPRKRAGRKFYAMLGRFLDLPEKDRENHRAGGGCIAF